MKIIQYLINGISIGSVYAIIALGYTMVYGIAQDAELCPWRRDHGGRVHIHFCAHQLIWGRRSVVSILAGHGGVYCCWAC